MLSLFVLSFITGIIGAFSGGGTSLILFPLLLWLTPNSYLQTLTITKIAALSMNISSAAVHIKKSRPQITLLLTLTIFGILGTAIGTYLVQYHLDANLFQIILGIFLLSTSAYLIFFKNKLGSTTLQAKTLTPKRLAIIALGATIINIFNGLFGGTGAVITLFLVIYLHYSFLRAVAYTMISYSIISFIQVSYLYLITETVPLQILLTVTGAFIGGTIGAKLQYIKGNKYVKIAAISIMTLLGIKSLFF